ncbi:MAG: glycosyltransferase [Desulfovibrionaceae bacterium]|nr:glycosyltransferase [Desulfovibrionaceae bacterium]
MPRRIVFLLEDLCYGGTQRQTLQLALRLDRSRFTPILLTLTGETDLDDEARAGGLEVLHMASGREVEPLFFARLLHVLRRIDADVLVPCTAMPNIWGRIWGRFLRGRFGRPLGVLGTVRGGGGPKRQHERWLWRLADHMVCNSEDLQRVLTGLGVPSERLTFIPNGVDTQRFAPQEPAPSGRAPLVVCVARLCEDKDHATLVGAFEKVCQVMPEARLRLVGDGPWEERVKACAAASGAAANIEILPGTPDVRPHLAEAAVFALSSVREGQPNVLLEAMASGLPVCATAVGGIPRMVAQDVNGLLSPSGDSAAMAANLLRLLRDGELADRMGRANRARTVEDFSFDAMVRAHQEIFDRLTGDAAAGGERA